MMAKEKPALQGGSKTTVHEDNSNFRIKREVRAIFSSGRKVTAVEINEIVGFNDARKVISVLRSEGWKIEDFRLPDRRKIYWLVPDTLQGELFPKGGQR